jgi:hypothetical protein
MSIGLTSIDQMSVNQKKVEPHLWLRFKLTAQLILKPKGSVLFANTRLACFVIDE